MVKSDALLACVYCGGEIPHRVRQTFRPFCLSAHTVVNAFYERIGLPIPRSLFHITVISCIFTARRYRGICYGFLSVGVCLSVTSQYFTKTAKRRITQTTPHDSAGTLVFWCQRSPRNSTGITPNRGAKCRCGGLKSATFDKLLAISRQEFYYRRGTARRTVSGKTVLNVAQMFVELHLISPALGEWPFQGHWKWQE